MTEKTQMLELMYLTESDPVDPDEVLSAVYCGGESYYIQVLVRPDRGYVWESDHLRRDRTGILGCTHGTELANVEFVDHKDATSYFWEFFADPEAGLMSCRL